MREVSKEKFLSAIKQLLTEIQYFLPEDVLESIRNALINETSSQAKNVLEKILENAKIASLLRLPLCQDTGIPQIFLEIGSEVYFNFDIKKEIENMVNEVYTKENLRKSCVTDPLIRGQNVHCYTLYTESVPGDSLKISVLLRGGGSENMSISTTFLPVSEIEEIKSFIVENVIKMLPYTCPPVIVSIGIGGTFELSSYLAKKALLKKIGERNNNGLYAVIEKDLKQQINNSNIGPLGLGGKTSVLDVFISVAPTHIATLPVSIILQCHSIRRGSITI